MEITSTLRCYLDKSFLMYSVDYLAQKPHELSAKLSPADFSYGLPLDTTIHNTSCPV